MTQIPSPEHRARLEAFLGDLSRALAGIRVQVSFGVEYGEDQLLIVMTGEDSDLFLQRKAEGLNALQHLLRKCVEAGEEGGDSPVVLDSHGYRRTRERELCEMARIGSDRARKSGTEFTLGPLNPYERRVIHLACQREGGVITKSIGDGFHKRIVIQPVNRTNGGNRG